MNHLPQLPPGAASVGAATALASVAIAIVGMTAARFGRRSAPLRHGLLLCTLLVLLALPAAPFAAAFIDVDWLPRYRLFRSDSKAGVSVVAMPAGATGSASARPMTDSAFQTLTSEEIPAGAILPGQSSRGLDSDSVGGSPRIPAGGSLRSTPATPTFARANSNVLAITAFGLWVVGSLIACLHTLRSGFAVARVVRHATPVRDAAILMLLTDRARLARLRRPPELRVTPAVRVPFAWGLRRPVIILPRRLADSAQMDRIEPVLLHELAHVSRRDAWVGLLQQIVAAMYWWNPLLRMLNARVADAREQICDAHVLAGGCPPRDYAELLVELASQVTLPQPAAALGLLSRSQPQLTRRVQHLLEDQPMSTSLRKFAKVCLMGVFIVLTVGAVLIAYMVIDEGLLFAQRRDTLLTQRRQAKAIVVPLRRPQPVAAQPAQGTYFPPTPISGDTTEWTPEPPALAFGESGDEGVGLQPRPDPNPFAAADEDFGGVQPVPQPLGGMFGGGGMMAGDMRDEDGAGPVWAGPRLHGLALIGLSANEDGSLKDLHWFTESLGAGDEAIAKLAERLKQFAGGRSGTAFRVEMREVTNADGSLTRVPVRVPYQVSQFPTGGTASEVSGGGRGPRIAGAADGPFDGAFGGGMPMAGGPAMGMMGMAAGPAPTTHLAAQISASPEIKYGELKRVIELCQQHVDQILFGGDDSELDPDITLTLGFVRDGGGSKISSSPVLIWNDATVMTPAAGPEWDAFAKVEEKRDEIVTVQDLPQRLLQWRQTLSGDAQPEHFTALIRPDAGIDSKLVEQVVQATLPAGVERVDIRWLASPTLPDEFQQGSSGIRVDGIPFAEPATTGDEFSDPSPEIEPASSPEGVDEGAAKPNFDFDAFQSEATPPAEEPEVSERSIDI